MAVMQNDAQKLRNLLNSGVSTRQKSVDGATAMHRAAEIGSIICAEILL
jgi:ankyrin repeat protein